MTLCHLTLADFQVCVCVGVRVCAAVPCLSHLKNGRALGRLTVRRVLLEFSWGRGCRKATYFSRSFELKNCTQNTIGIPTEKRSDPKDIRS